MLNINICMYECLQQSHGSEAVGFDWALTRGSTEVISPVQALTLHDRK